MTAFDTRADWKRAGLSFALMLVAYMATMAPTVTLEQSGALTVAADHGGIGKFPGFPIWHMVGAGFTRLFSFVTYQGRPNPAWAVNLLSVCCGALACGGVAFIVSRISGRLSPTGDDPVPAPILTASSVSAALLFGFSPVMWSQSVITETHAMTACFAAWYLALLIVWVSRRDSAMDWAVAFLFGLAFSVSQLLWLFAPAALLAAAMVDRKRRLLLAARCWPRRVLLCCSCGGTAFVRRCCFRGFGYGLSWSRLSPGQPGASPPIIC